VLKYPNIFRVPRNLLVFNENAIRGCVIASNPTGNTIQIIPSSGQEVPVVISKEALMFPIPAIRGALNLAPSSPKKITELNIRLFEHEPLENRLTFDPFPASFEAHIDSCLPLFLDSIPRTPGRNMN
jgi:hypothetical protein